MGAKEAEKIRGYISCVAVQGEEPVERIDVTPDLSITMEEEEEVEEGRPVSPPPCHLAPILVPSLPHPHHASSLPTQPSTHNNLRWTLRNGGGGGIVRQAGDTENVLGGIQSF